MRVQARIWKSITSSRIPVNEVLRLVVDPRLMHSRTPRVSQWEICEAFCCYWAPEGSILWADEESRTTRIRSALGLTYEVMSFRSNRNTAIPMSSAKAIRL